MYVRGVLPARTRAFARYGAVAAALAATVTAAALTNTAAAQSGAEPGSPAMTGQAASVGDAAPAPVAATSAADRGGAATAAARESGARLPAPAPAPPTGPGGRPLPTVVPTPGGAPQVVARYSFEQRARRIADLSGHGNTLRVRVVHGGRVGLVARAGGGALAFPSRCRTRPCPRVVLQAPHAPELNPGTAAFAYGATVRLAPTQTTKGQNVLQKGYAARGQYKLQIDGAAGKPSCVLVGGHPSTLRYLVKSSVTVADGRWHRVECRRSGTGLAIAVDGSVRGVVAVPHGLSIANEAPLSIGGKGRHQDNDQYQGAVDDVWVSIG
ncbi:MAG TPA: LamG-like jellyroll fold domain-containing protein [Actinoplanes sp.]|nr:LamG-like jellyroll fold domain-containing protein [Actinoplanes sp.]